MAHDVTYLVCKNKSFVEGYSKEQMEKGDFTAGNALKLNGKEESQLDVHSADSAAYAAEAGYLRYGGFTAGTIDGVNGFNAYLRDGWTYLCMANYTTFIFSIHLINDGVGGQPPVSSRTFRSTLSPYIHNEDSREYLEIDYKIDTTQQSNIKLRYKNPVTEEWEYYPVDVPIVILPIVRTTSQNV